ncbi:class II aldolase/adducin family protein [Amycolatopsis pithecellobii]|uniref:Class II aldolase/adducin family protein n=1 Tax=Amycolatopsis pithecellobii TaxID=664692 RepID=A0A6N7YZA6_9PSEU|nr:class II aldolase/adducin family protein [Amycolatopsis pithecellobii]MTD53729.1 class II aldolase/adducin family protein [Amycolatopsis pithecellobii]
MTAAHTVRPTRDQVLKNLVIANRVLAAYEVVDGWGHVSARDPDDADSFIMSAVRAPALVRERDLVAIRVGDGEPPAQIKASVERHIHAGIYRSRKDVTAVVHCHAEALIPFGVAGVPLRPLAHTDAFLIDGCPIWEIRAATYRDTMLVDTAELGDSLAATLAQAPIALMRGHGATIVGASIHEAVYRAIYARHAALVDLAGRSLGTVRYLSTDEARSAADSTVKTFDRTWELWSTQHGATSL